MITQTQLEGDLRRLGIRAGSRVVVHSSLRAVGHVEGGAETAAAALIGVVGPEGLVVAPTFTYDSPRFDPAVTPGRTGALAEALRRRPDAVRSLHPFYSVAAVGSGAAELCAGHELLAATAAGTPLDRLAASGGLVLLLGVDHTANTTAHVGEFRADAPYLDIPFDPTWPTEAEVLLPDGSTRRYAYDRFPGCSRAFGALDRPLTGVTHAGRVGAASALLVPGEAVIDAVVSLLRTDVAALLCGDQDSYRCVRARARL